MASLRPVDPGIKRLWEQLEDKEFAIVKERRRLQDVWKQITLMHKKNAEARAEFEQKAAFDFLPPDERIALNVGGNVFETTAGVLCRDRFSFLAALCKTEPPISKDKNGHFFFDRDWWIFRHILQFLRTGDLPEDHALLREMHDEASYYRLNSLKRAAERKSAEMAIETSRVKTSDEANERGAHGQRQRPSVLGASAGVSKSHASTYPWGTAMGAAGQDRRVAGERSPSVQYRAPLPDPYGFRMKQQYPYR